MNDEDDLDRYLERARREMFPKMKGSALCLTILGDPDPKLALELGAAILFNKPIVLCVPKGREVPLSLRTIAHKIVEVDDMNDEESRKLLTAAISEVMETLPFRK